MGKKIRDNYKAWSVKISQFSRLNSQEKKLKHLVKLALLAPSGHNAQPWHVDIVDSQIKISISDQRLLPVGDASNRLTYIGIGCFLQNLYIAADYYGYKINTKFSDYQNKICTVSVSKKGPQKKSLNHLVNYIPQRVTNRNKYVESDEISNLIETINNKLPAGISLETLLPNDAIKDMAEDVIDAGIETFEDKAFRNELSHHVRSNITKKHTGMPAFGMGMPTPVSLIVPQLIKLANVNKLSRKKDIDLVANHTPLYALLTSKENTQKDWINAGLSYELIALHATRLGLSIHPYAGPLIIPKYNKKMKKYFGTKNYPQMFFRVGKPVAQTHHSPRLNVNDIITT